MAEWTTGTAGGDNPHTLYLPAGDYTLQEVTAPTGYEKANDIAFTVTVDGKVMVDGVEKTAVEMKDTRVTKVTVSKIASDTNAALPGAKLAVKQDDTVIEEWITDGTAHKLSLPAGTYTLCETEAPDGYEVAADIEFQVTSDGKLLINGQAVDTLTMTDKKKQTSTPTPVVTPTPTPTPSTPTPTPSTPTPTPSTTTPTPTPAATPKPTPVETPGPTATPAAPKPATTIPRTADDYPLIPLAIAFVASGAALGLGLGKKRRHYS